MEHITLEELPENIQLDQLKKYLINKNINFKSIKINKDTKGKANAIITYKINDIPDITIFDEIDMEVIPNTKSIIQISYGNKEIPLNHQHVYHNEQEDLKENDEIPYSSLYHQHIITQFMRVSGKEGLQFNNLPVLDIQKKQMQRYVSKIGVNIMSKSALLNITLPIAIFDQRSLLEVFAHQYILSPYYLEKAGVINDNPIEVLKLTTAFFISQLHLSVTQLKPCNPLIGETFQCKIDDSMLYIERTTKESLAYNYYHLGRHFKAYGYQIPYAITNENGISVSSSSNHSIYYPNGTIINIIPCHHLNIKGTLIGDRTISLSDQCYIVDKMNNYLVYIDFNTNKRNDYPDKFKGYILRLDQSTYDYRNNTYTLNKNYTSLVDINGYWSNELIFDDDVYWNYYEYTHYPLERMKYTLLSDSTFRQDIVYLKLNQEDNGVKIRAYLEYMQRRDQKLRDNK